MSTIPRNPFVLVSSNRRFTRSLQKKIRIKYFFSIEWLTKDNKNMLNNTKIIRKLRIADLSKQIIKTLSPSLKGIDNLDYPRTDSNPLRPKLLKRIHIQMQFLSWSHLPSLRNNFPMLKSSRHLQQLFIGVAPEGRFDFLGIAHNLKRLNELKLVHLRLESFKLVELLDFIELLPQVENFSFWTKYLQIPKKDERVYLDFTKLKLFTFPL